MPQGRVANVKDVDGSKFVVAYAAHLKKEGKMKVPKWHDIVKTGNLKELPPYNVDWFYVRAAALARQVYLRPGTGVGALRDRYGGGKTKGNQPNHHGRGSEAIQRKALQQLEIMGIIQKMSTGGRKLTVKGQQDLDRIAATMIYGEAKPKQPKQPKEQKQ